MSENRRFKLKGHESFAIREGWITKGLEAIGTSPQAFSVFYGADTLGVGTNMAKSIRYWMRACGLIHENSSKGVYLTDQLGSIILTYDKYLEDLFSLWILHINLVTNLSLATVWYLFFNRIDAEEFTREGLFLLIRNELVKYIGNDEFSDKSLMDDCATLLIMYYKERNKGYDPEDKRICPFTALGLLKSDGRYFSKKQPAIDKLHPLVVLYLISPQLENGTGASMEHLLSGENGAQRILHLKRSVFDDYLDQLAQMGYITINRTAGLDMVYRLQAWKREDILSGYYKRQVRWRKDVSVEGNH